MPQWPLPPGEPPIYPSTPGGQTAPDIDPWQFVYNGVTFGAGTDIGLLKVRGMGALPDVGSEDLAFPRDTGQYIGVDAMGGRDPETDLILTSNIYVQMVNLGGAFFAGGVNEQPLWFQLPGLPTICSMVRPRKRVSDWDTLVSAAGMWTPTVTWHATDPRLYEQAQIADSASSDSGSVSLTVTNSGNVEMRPVMLLTGPLDAPSITNTSIGSAGNYPAIVFADGTGIDDGDQVVIDFSTPHTLQYFVGGLATPSSTYNVYSWLSQGSDGTSWWNLPPGANVLTCAASQDSLAADQFEVWWSNAYML